MAGLEAQQTWRQTDLTGWLPVQQVPRSAQLSVESVAVPVAEVPSAVGCTRRESKRSYQRGWSFVAGTTAVDSGSFAVASGSFERGSGSGSGSGSQIGSAKDSLAEGLRLDFVAGIAATTD